MSSSDNTRQRKLQLLAALSAAVAASVPVTAVEMTLVFQFMLTVMSLYGP